MASLHDAVRKLERLHGQPRRGGLTLVQPHRLHVSDFGGRIAPARQIQHVPAVGGENQPRRRQRLRLGLDKRVVDAHRLAGRCSVAGHDVFRVRPIVDGKDQRRHVPVGLHGWVTVEVVQRDPVPLAPQRLGGQVSGGGVRTGPCAGCLAHPPEDVPALFPLHILCRPHRHRQGRVIRVHVPAVLEIHAQLSRQSADPPAQRSGEGGGCQKFPVCQQADDVHQIPLHNQAVVTGPPSAGILVEDPQPLVLVRAVRQPDAQRYVDALPLLNGLKQPVFTSRFKPPGQVVDLENARAVWQRRGRDVALLLYIELRDHASVPRLIYAGDDLYHPHPPTGA